MRHFLIFLCGCALLLSACHKEKDDPTPAPPEADRRTVLVYVAGENSLSKYYAEEFTEMCEGSMSIGDKDHLLVYVDIADAIRKPYLMEVSKGDTVTIHQYTEDMLSCDPDVMLNVIRRAFEARPAQSYGLVLWGHSSGWIIKTDSVENNMMARRPAYGVDNNKNGTTNAGMWINIPTLTKVLLRAGYPLRFIFADCCNFQCTEVAYEMRNTADYIIGSPAVIPGKGAPYNTVVPAMFSQSDTFYREIADAYYAQKVNGCKVPLSVVKTSEMSALADATRTALKSFAATFDGQMPDMTGLIYYLGNRASAAYRVMYDMNDFMLRYASEDDYNVWRQAFDRAVVYRRMSTEWVTSNLVDFNDFEVTEERYGGLSMFVPQAVTKATYYLYNTDIKKMGWYYAAGYADVGW